MRTKHHSIITVVIIFLFILFNALFAQGLQNVSVNLEDSEAGVATIYTFNFTTGAGGIPADGKIVITLQQGFHLSDLIFAQTTDDLIMAGGFKTSGAAGVIALERDGTGALVAANTDVGVKVAGIENHQTAAVYTATIETQQNNGDTIDSSTPSTFTIRHNSLDQFEFETISNHDAGENFVINITAKDKYGNVVEDFESTVELSDTSRTISPTSTTDFTSGIWSENVSITKSGANNEITAIYQNKSGVSNKFNITHGLLNRFVIDEINSPQTAGNSFSIRIVARDQYQNIVKSFEETVALTDFSGSIQAVPDNFNAGILENQSVIITKSQPDNFIIATDPATSKTGQSNLFNVVAGNSAKFYIEPISDQVAGESFPIIVIAQDNNNNTVSNFDGKVTIADNSNSINPSLSDKFVGGIWSGDVAISLPEANNIITVTKSPGTETGSSNSFNVTEGGLHSFSIDNISSPQEAGTKFSITIRAKDKAGNTISSFADNVNINDLTYSIDRQQSENFTNGEWTGFVTITKARANNRIIVSGNNKDGNSNQFDVNPGILSHFYISDISSPQIAGQNFPISIEAHDANENVVTSFTDAVNLAEETATISLSSTPNFVVGTWSGIVNITQKSENNKITVIDPTSSKAGESDYFNVRPAAVNHITIRDNPGGLGSEVEAITFNIGEQKKLYAAGYDLWHNYVREVVANWETTGNINQPSPLQGTNTIFRPITPYTSGRIYADSVSVGADSTGIFTVGTIHHVLIRETAGGAGNTVENVEISADDSLVLYAAAYDEGNSYLGPASVNWSNNGALQPLVSGSGNKFVYYPTTSGVTGQIIASHAIAPIATTGIITIHPGAPVGTIILHSNPKIIEAHPDSFSTITSEPIYDSDGNSIAENELFTVSTNLGTITSTDEDLNVNGVQIKSDAESKLTFVVHAGTEGGTAQIYVSSIGTGGNAIGETTLIFANLNIVSVNVDFERLSRGQTNVPIRMVVENLSSENITIVNAGLKFTGPAPFNNTLTGEYTVSRTDVLTQILARTQSTLTFETNLAEDATTGLIRIDGFFTGDLNSKSVIDTSANLIDEVMVQSPPVLSIEKIEAFADTVIQGTSTTVKATIRNNGEASVIINSDSLTFWAENFGVNETKKYGQIAYLSNPDTLIGNSSEVFTYTVQVGTNALIDTVTLDGKITGRDINSNEIVSDIGANELDGWWVKQASDVEIIEFSTSQLTVTDGQEEDWYITMVVNNSGGADLKLDSVVVEFSIGGRNISNEYTLIYPGTFMSSGNDILQAGATDMLRITVGKTGITQGTMTITGTVFLGDMISGQVIKNSVTGITVQSPAQLTIDYIHTSQPEVTVGQNSPWQIILSLTNSGGGDIAIDSTRLTNFINFADGNDSYTITTPAGFYGSNTFVLKSGQTDSLFFTINKTGIVTGDININIKIWAVEINSQRNIFVEDNTQILIESPAEIKIASTENIAPNSPYVNTEQEFQIRVVVLNTGEDAATNINVSLESDSSSTLLNPTGNLSLLRGGESDTLSFNILSSSRRIVDETYSSKIIAASAENTPEPDKITIATPLDSFANAIVQVPAEMKIISVKSSADTVKAYSTKEWDITVAVKNNGDGNLVLTKPKASDISIFKSNVSQQGYEINAPSGFQHSPDLKLAADEEDQLIYKISRTGYEGGTVTVKASLTGKYLNTTQSYLVSDSTEVYVIPSADLFIDITEPNCFYTSSGIAQVNSGQIFSIDVKVVNSGAEEVGNVSVALSAPGYSFDPQTIEKVQPSGNAVTSFNVTAEDVQEQATFTANIILATAVESGLPATIGSSSDSTADVRIHEPARLKINIDTQETIFTANQANSFQLHVSNLGTAEVDESGQLAVFAPPGYLIDKGNKRVQADTTNFIIDQELSWQIIPPSVQSNNDTIKVVLFHSPNDKNVNSAAYVENAVEGLVVRTVASNIFIQKFSIDSPEGAKDDTISTWQDFSVKLDIIPSENLKDLRASVIIPSNFGYGIQEDSLKFLLSNSGTWKLRAPGAANSEPAWIKVNVYGKTNGKTETVQDSFAVVVKKRAEIIIDDIWTSSNNDSILSSGKEFDLNVLISSKNSNQAKVVGEALVRVSFGATDITTEDNLTQSFKVDSAVTWRINAPEYAKGRSPLTIYLESIPLDENTDSTAIISDEVTTEQFYVETVIFGNITTSNFRITYPIGATDRILSSYQSFDVEAEVEWQNTSDIPTANLKLPPGFTTLESNPKKPADIGQQGTVAWTIYAPETVVSNQNIWIQLSAKDANNGSSFLINSDSIEVDIVNRPEILLNAQIISPASALDGQISAGDFFVLNAFLEKTGEADLTGNYSIELILPEEQDYTSVQSLIQQANWDQTIEWTIKAPLSTRNTQNMTIDLISAPKDENTNRTIIADAIINDDVSIPISTEEKSVTISTRADNGKNTIARGDTGITVLGLEFMVSGDEYSNNVLFSGVKIKLKDRLGNIVENPQHAISRIKVVNHLNTNLVYGSVAEIPVTNPIEIVFSKIDTLKPKIPNRIDFKVDISQNASITDFQLTIDSSQALQFIDEGSGRIPNIKNEAGETIDELNIFSASSVIIQADFEESFFNYPNPFGEANKPETYFVYYLEQDSDVRIQIYTILGERVWAKTFTQNDPQGKKGPHEGDVIWNARNDLGHKVLNGVYVARISTADNKEAIIKIAVIK
jgi:hypothetical protein